MTVETSRDTIVRIDKSALGEVAHQGVEQGRAFSVGAGLHIGDRSLHPIHLPVFTKKQSRLSRHRVIAHQRLALWPLMREQHNRWLAASDCSLGPPGPGQRMDTIQIADPGLEGIA